MDIIRLKAPSPQEFDREFLKAGKPVLIESALENWPALNWNLDYLCEKCGGNEVFVRRGTTADDYKVGLKYTVQPTTVKNYIENVKNNTEWAQSSYLAVQNIKKALPQIEHEAPMPEYVQKLHAGPFLWVARKGHYEYCHFDPDDNFLIMIAGQKHVRLFCCELAPLYPHPKGSKGRTIQSQVNVNEPDLSKYPEFSRAVMYECIVNPGEMLFIPGFWWHQVTSIETAISINVFFGDSGSNTFLTKIMNSSQREAFYHWLLNIIEQNRELDSFRRVLAHLPDCLINFLMKQWHEEADEQQVKQLVKLVMEYCSIDTLPHEERRSRNPPLLKIRGLLWRA